MPARTRVFIDALVKQFTGPECQGIEASVQKTKTQLRQPRPAATAVKSGEAASKRDR